MSTTGGSNLSRHIRQAKAQAGETIVDIGFKGNVSTLAAQHEFGNRSLPERPAMRASTRDLEDIVVQSKATSHDEIVEAGVLMRDAMRNSYLNFHGAPLSERQRERKAGTKGEGRQLVGAEGPKLIEHIHVYLNDEQVD